MLTLITKLLTNIFNIKNKEINTSMLTLITKLYADEAKIKGSNNKKLNMKELNRLKEVTKKV